MVPRHQLERMPREPAVQAMDDSGVLHAIIREEQRARDRAHALELNIAHHLAQPLRLNHLGVVVQQQNVIGIALLDGAIVQMREAESPGRRLDAAKPVASIVRR